MSEDKEKLELVKTPEPYHLILSPSLYKSIKYNQTHHGDKAKISKYEAEEFEKFKRLFKEFVSKMNSQDPSAFAVLSVLMGMWGYNRKYCGMCGKPIIGKPGHIQNRMVCKTCDDSFKIAEELYKREEHDNPRKQHINNNSPKEKSK